MSGQTAMASVAGADLRLVVGTCSPSLKIPSTTAAVARASACAFTEIGAGYVSSGVETRTANLYRLHTCVPSSIAQRCAQLGAGLGPKHVAVGGGPAQRIQQRRSTPLAHCRDLSPMPAQSGKRSRRKRLLKHAEHEVHILVYRRPSELEQAFSLSLAHTGMPTYRTPFALSQRVGDRSGR